MKFKPEDFEIHFLTIDCQKAILQLTGIEGYGGLQSISAMIGQQVTEQANEVEKILHD